MINLSYTLRLCVFAHFAILLCPLVLLYELVLLQNPVLVDDVYKLSAPWLYRMLVATFGISATFFIVFYILDLILEKVVLGFLIWIRSIILPLRIHYAIAKICGITGLILKVALGLIYVVILGTPFGIYIAFTSITRSTLAPFQDCSMRGTKGFTSLSKTPTTRSEFSNYLLALEMRQLSVASSRVSATPHNMKRCHTLGAVMQFFAG
jgi:hypothetical protein